MPFAAEWKHKKELTAFPLSRNSIFEKIYEENIIFKPETKMELIKFEKQVFSAFSYGNSRIFYVFSKTRNLNKDLDFFATAIGCPEVSVPNGSFVSNETVESRTFRCRDAGWLFPDTGKDTRTLDCIEGRWNESIDNLPNCVGE